MKGIIVGFERATVQQEVEEKGKKFVVNKPVAVLTIQTTDLPDLLRIGKFVELTVAKEEKKEEESSEKNK